MRRRQFRLSEPEDGFLGAAGPCAGRSEILGQAPVILHPAAAHRLGKVRPALGELGGLTVGAASRHWIWEPCNWNR
jgi:hypothetical protein